MLRRRNRINRKTADREILHAYEDVRNERRASNYLLPMVLLGKAVFFGSFLLAMLIAETGMARAYIMLSITGAYLLTCFVLMIRWSTHGRRWHAFGMIVCFLILIGGLVAVIQLAMNSAIS
jgi:ABC-type multidrug transport system permease subunit